MNDQLKHRLLGAIVLVALAVIFIPMIFDFRDDRKNITGSPIPPKPKEAFTTLTIPLQPNTPVAPSAPVQAEPVQPVPTPKPEPVVVQPQPESKKTPPSTKLTPEVKKPPSAPSGPSPNAWVVQLGSFSSEKNAITLRDRLRKAGFAAYVEKVPGKKDVVRVRIGPELKRDKAEALKERLKKELKQQAVVMPYR